MDLASVVAALASVGVRVSGSTPNSSVQVDSSRACPTGLAGPEPSGTINDPGQHFQKPWTRLDSRRCPSRSTVLHESLCSGWRPCISSSLQGPGDFAGCGTSTTMASKLQSNCQLEGTVRRHPTWFELVLVIFWRIKTFHPATVSSCFKAGSSFDTFIQFLESESGWESYPTCQGTP